MVSAALVWIGISVSNFMCMSFVAVGRSLTIVSYVSFKMAALWFWTMFNCNPPIAHCHPLLWGGGILVDHWSTISSSFKKMHLKMSGKWWPFCLGLNVLMKVIPVLMRAKIVPLIYIQAVSPEHPSKSMHITWHSFKWTNWIMNSKPQLGQIHHNLPV